MTGKRRGGREADHGRGRTPILSTEGPALLVLVI